MCFSWFFCLLGGHLRNIRSFSIITKWSKMFLFYRHIILRSLGQVKKVVDIFCINNVLFLILWPFWGHYVIFIYFQAVTKRNTVLLSLNYHDILRSLEKVKIYFRHFCIVYVFFLMFLLFRRHLRNIWSFLDSYEKK